MPIKTRCQCGARFAVPDKFAGRTAKCPKCNQPVQIPRADPSSAPSQPTAAATVRCECGKSLKVPPQAAGRSVKCPHCGQAVAVPARARAATPMGAARQEEQAVAELLDEADLSLSRTGRRCPECRRDMQVDDVICVGCGYNSETGKKIKVKKVESVKRIGDVIVSDLDKRPKADAPPPVQALVKLLNQAGALAIVMGIAVVAFLGYQKMQANPNLGTEAIFEILQGTGGYVLGACILLITIPCAVAANLVQTGKAAGRILSIVVGVISLLGVPILTLLGVLILRLAFSDDVSRYCN